MTRRLHILSSYSFLEDGRARHLSSDETVEELKNQNLSWVHLDGNNPHSKLWLERKAPYLDHLIIDALFTEEARPRIMEFEAGILIILRATNLDKKSDADDMVSIRLWIDESRIVSIQKRDCASVANLIQRIEKGHKIRSSAEFLYNLIYEILSATAPIIIDLNEKLDLIEDKVASGKNDHELRESVTIIRKQAAVFKRYMLPQKEVISQLKINEYNWIDEWAIRHFQENYDQISNVIEEIDEAKERSQIIHHEISNLIADKINKLMLKISLFASVFLPLSFVASLFGMNVGGIPFENHKHGFFIICYFMIIVFGALYFFLKNKKIF